MITIEERPLSALKPYATNAKLHPERQVKKIAASISRFGFLVPIIVDKEGIIIAGHGRYLAAVLLGLEVVPTTQCDHLTSDEVKAYRLADNKLSEGDFDMDLVISELRSLDLPLVDLTGFNSNITLETKEDKPNLTPLTSPITTPGDVYDLGPHRLVCNDATNEATYRQLLGDDKARLIFTDPPYSINYQSGSGISDPSEKFHLAGKIMGDDRTPDEALVFYRDTLRLLHQFSTSDCNLYWWYASRLVDVNLAAWRETKWHFSQAIVWLKEGFIFSPGQNYHRAYEPCLVGWKEGETHFQDMTFSSYSELWTLDNKKFPDYLDAWYNKRDNTNKYIHPTQKPVQLAERALKRSSERGDLVLDAFGGSGSTLIACDQLERKARIIEIDPKYCDAIVSRYCQYKDDYGIIKNGEPIQWIRP